MTRRPSARAGFYTPMVRVGPLALSGAPAKPVIAGCEYCRHGATLGEPCERDCPRRTEGLDAHTISILGQAGRLAARKAQSSDPSKRVPAQSAWDGVRPVLLANKPLSAAQELQARMVFVTAYNLASGGGA